MTELYSALQQKLHVYLTSETLFILIGIAIVLALIAVFVLGGIRIATKGRLKWLVLHTLSLFLVGYIVTPFSMNKFVIILIFGAGVTLLSLIYRYLLYTTIPKFKSTLIWFGINSISLLILKMLYAALSVNEPVLQLFFAAFALTWVGTMVHGKFK